MTEEELDPDRLAHDSSCYRRRVVELAPGQELRLEPQAWRDAIVFLTAGEIELECARGECRRFARGAVLCLLPPVTLVRATGGGPARLLAISRRAPRLQKNTG